MLKGIATQNTEAERPVITIVPKIKATKRMPGI